MKLNWYYRMMLSYLPIFFVVISSIIIIFFLVLNSASEKKYIETNEAILERMIYNTDTNLMLIERNIISQLLMDDLVQSFFSNESKSAYEYFELQRKLTELRSTFPFRNTMYMYNEADQRIISDLGAYHLDSFGDRDFLLSNYTGEELQGWTPPRWFVYWNSGENEQKVVSIVKPYYDGQTKLGAVVVNVYVSYIEEYLNSFSESDSIEVKLADAGVDMNTGSMHEDDGALIRATSDYTGWTYLSAGLHATSYNTLSLISSVWMIVVLIIIVLALVGFTLLTHMHYKPIQSIMEKVGQFTARKNEYIGIKLAKNEFTFIETALDHLLQRSLDYENLYKEDTVLKQQRLLHDLLSGHQVLSDREFVEQMQSLQLPYQFDRLGVIVAEIDHYTDFTNKYKAKDQHLLKFIIERVFHDLGQQHNRFVWHAWMAQHRIAYVVYIPTTAPPHSTLKALAEEFRRWIEENLELTITIGLGADSTSIDSIADSYRNALDNVELKTVFGPNSLIDNRVSASKRSLDSYAYLQALENVVHALRMNQREWRQALHEIFGQLREMRFARSDMMAFIHNFVMLMGKAVTPMSSNIHEAWTHDIEPAFYALHDQVETLTELEEQFMALTSAFETVVVQDRQERRHHHIAQRAKRYIDEHFMDSELSQSQVSDYLELQPSALSQLFKDEFGENFSEYLLKIRMEHAKKLLVETDKPVQSIAEQIGYQNINSFYRVFKKAAGIPPGEYRQMYRVSNQSS